MRQSLRALLNRIVDYAGLFPPARLSLDEALHNYARYRTEPENWMLGSFVCPAARLAELEPYYELFREGPPWSFSVLGRGGNTHEEFLEGLRADLKAVASFEFLNELWSRSYSWDRPRVIATSLETTLPSQVLRSPNPPCTADHLLRESGLLLEKHNPDTGLPPYYELPRVPEWKPLALQLLEALSLQPGVGDPRLLRYTIPQGFKVRCGGLEPSAFPPAADLAFVIRSAGEWGVPLKFTAGLHHPVRRFDASVGTKMHGFLSVFGAVVLRASGSDRLHFNPQVEEEQLQMILEDEDPSHFIFDDEGFRWKDLKATVQEISHARSAAWSFGSCSFDEPRDDLRALGLLE
jgi:hypothetical protein